MCLQSNDLRFSTSTPTTQRIQLFDSKFPPVFHCQKVTDHSACLPHFLLLNAEGKSSSRTDEVRHYDCHVKFVNNTSGRARLWDTALKFFLPRPLYYVTRSVFHLPKKSGNSGRVVNGTRLFGSFLWNFTE